MGFGLKRRKDKRQEKELSRRSRRDGTGVGEGMRLLCRFAPRNDKGQEQAVERRGEGRGSRVGTDELKVEG